jgi:hypothetical protein
MKLYLAYLSAVILGSNPAIATDIRTAPASQALDVVQFDFNDDGYTDRAILIEDEAPEARLVIYTATQDGMDSGTELKEPVWSGFIHGQFAQLHTIGRNSLSVISSNQSIGRNRWTQHLTIAYRRNAYRVVGFTYDFYDTLDAANNGSCDVNYLSGQADIRYGQNKSNMQHAYKAIPIKEWTVDQVPDACFGG